MDPLSFFSLLRASGMTEFYENQVNLGKDDREGCKVAVFFLGRKLNWLY